MPPSYILWASQSHRSLVNQPYRCERSSRETKSGRGVKKVKSQVGDWGLAANWLTAGIWTPVTVKITCAR